MLQATTTTGIYGKLPAHGDFIYRNLPTRFINVWDGWLQGFISSSQEQLGQDWLDIYLTSPLWRFAFSEGVIDERCWLGIVLPSVDRVGRYFPFSVVRPIDNSIPPAVALHSQEAWYEAVEAAALSALEGARQIQDLLPEIGSLQIEEGRSYQSQRVAKTGLGTVIRSPFDEQPLRHSNGYFVDACLRTSLHSYSIWGTSGSHYVEPCVFYAAGLPQRRGLTAMLDGKWQERGWQEPFIHRDTSSPGESAL